MGHFLRIDNRLQLLGGILVGFFLLRPLFRTNHWANQAYLHYQPSCWAFFLRWSLSLSINELAVAHSNVWLAVVLPSRDLRSHHTAVRIWRSYSSSSLWQLQSLRYELNHFLLDTEILEKHEISDGNGEIVLDSAYGRWAMHRIDIRMWWTVLQGLLFFYYVMVCWSHDSHGCEKRRSFLATSSLFIAIITIIQESMRTAAIIKASKESELRFLNGNRAQRLVRDSRKWYTEWQWIYAIS